MLREKFFRQASDLDVVTAQSAEIFDEHCRRLSKLELLNHFLEARPVHRDAGNAVVEKVDQVCVSFLFGDLG